MNVEERVAFVTEGPGAHGKALCLALAAHGYAVGFTYGGREEDAASLRAEIEAMGVRALPHPVRQFHAPELGVAIVETAEQFGGVDLLVYLNEPPLAREQPERLLLDIDEEDWDAVMDRGAKGFFLTCKYVLPYLISRRGARLFAVDFHIGTCADCALTDYVSSRALEAAAAHIATEMSMYGIPAEYRRISEDEDWVADIAELLDV